LEEALPCPTPGCGKTATLTCPTCRKLGIDAAHSHFCSQQCFKSYWPEHKKVHALLAAPREARDSGAASKPKDDGFAYTGTLRMGTKSPWREIPASIDKPDYYEGGEPISEQRSRKSGQIVVHSKEEVDKIRVCCKLAREVYGDMCGVTTLTCSTA